MKKKFFIGIAMSLFAVATVFNMNLSEQGNAGDVSLEAIEVMAKAEAEIYLPGNKVCKNGRCTWRFISGNRRCRTSATCTGFN